MNPDMVKLSAVSELIRQIRSGAREKIGYEEVKLRKSTKTE
jgi:hypothetical protein